MGNEIMEIIGSHAYNSYIQCCPSSSVVVVVVVVLVTVLVVAELVVVVVTQVPHIARHVDFAFFPSRSSREHASTVCLVPQSIGSGFPLAANGAALHALQVTAALPVVPVVAAAAAALCVRESKASLSTMDLTLTRRFEEGNCEHFLFIF